VTLLASRQLRWTTNLPEEYIHNKLPENLRKSLLAQLPTITRKNVDKPNNTNTTYCTIHSHQFQGLSMTDAFNLFRAAAIKTLHKHLTAVDHKHQKQRANSLDNISQASQALLQALDSMQSTIPWHGDERQGTMVFTPTEVG
jgi:hypothetical protein